MREVQNITGYSQPLGSMGLSLNTTPPYCMKNNNIYFTGEYTLNNNQMTYITNRRLFLASPTKLCFSCSDNKLTVDTTYTIGNTSEMI